MTEGLHHASRRSARPTPAGPTMTIHGSSYHNMGGHSFHWPLLGATEATGRWADNFSKIRTRAVTDDENCQSRGRGFKSRRAHHKIDR